MSPDEMFRDYRLLSPDTPDYSHCIFSEAHEDILSGALTLADIPYEVFACYGEELPAKGDVEAVVTEKGDAVCLIRITDVKMIPTTSGNGRLFFPSFLEDDGYLVEIAFRKIFS